MGRVRVSLFGFISRVRVRIRFWLRPGTPLDPKFAGYGPIGWLQPWLLSLQT